MQVIIDWLTFPNISGLASVVGLVLTLYVFFSIRKIEREFLFRVRLPSLLKKLQQHTSKIAGALQNYPDSENEVIEELSIAKVNINSLHKKSSGSVKNSLKSLEIEIENFRTNKSNRNSKKSLRDIHLGMNMVIQEISNMQEDDKWRQRGG